ncbi:hypothetical protein EX895_003327 [Sporisorium graminicola]|uniref:Uncharacterized protein n=1 Tax=Sporisorium graminicola TaxID=280036 RepID=A0A4U7KUD3_9BASI|nr:hypothetical protein EX895_003327 [Sporisorium graminicola]TKY87746.1 hypothetical protein EX895_003327 [Sporisorium graminicola]
MMLHRHFAVLLVAFTLAPASASAQPSASASAGDPVVTTSAFSIGFDSPDSITVPSQSSLFHSFWDNLSRHWTEADSTKQTLMAILLIVQLVFLFYFVKRSLDKMFGRRAEYRNQRTKRFARRAAVAAAGGSSKYGIPLSHQRPLYRPDVKPQLPPRPSQNHPLLRPSTSSASQAEFQTTHTGDIVLPSWTDAGPTPLKVIVEEPDEELVRSNSPLSARPHSPASPGHADTSRHSWSFAAASPRDNTSLRLRERNDYSILPFNIDRSSTPDTRLEEVRRPFTRPIYSDDHLSQPPSHHYYVDSLSAPSTSPA